MSRLHLLRIVPVAAIATLALAGCESGTEPVDQVVRQTVGSEGGTVVAPGLTLDIPPGALTDDVEISVEALSGEVAPSGFLALEGTAYDFGPDGLTFAEPVTLTLDYAADRVPDGVGRPELRVLRLSGGPSALPSTSPTAGRVSAPVEHFSTFAVGLEIGDVSRVACPALAPAATRGAPLQEVDLGSIPQEFTDPLVVQVTTATDSLVSYGPVVRDSQGTRMRVPLRPDGDPAGGDVVLTVTDGVRACAGFGFSVDPLPGAEGELGAIVDGLQRIVDQQAMDLGSSRDELLTTPADQMPVGLLPLAMVQSVIDHPDNPDALRAVADGTSPSSAAARLDVLEGLLATTGLRAALASSPQPATGPAAVDGPARAVSAFLCDPENISGAQQLDDCMSAAATAAFRASGASGKVLSDLGAALGVAGFVPGLGTATAVGGAVTWAILNQQNKTAATYPNALDELRAFVEPREFLEDQAGNGSWRAWVRASNQSWDSGKEMLEGLLQAAGLVGNFDDIQIGGPEPSELVAWALTNPVANELLSGGTLEEFQTTVSTTPEIEVSEVTWSESEIVGAAFAKTAHNDFEPRAPGEATLVLRTKGGAFGGQQVTAQETLTVQELTLDISPDPVALKEGEPQGFTVTVRNSSHPEMVEIDPDVSLQGTVESIAYVGEGIHVVDYTAPSTPDRSKPDLLTVRHTATTGARGYADGYASATATIRFGDVTISPAGICLEPGQTQTFQAEVTGVTDATVVWSASAGSFSENVYTAPSTPPQDGQVTITATSVENSELSDTVTVRVGPCLCRMDVAASGGINGTSTGPSSFQQEEDGALWVLGGNPMSEGLHLSFRSEEWPGTTGTFPVSSANLSTDDVNVFGIYHPDYGADCTTCGGSVDIVQVTAENIVGSVQVTMVSRTLVNDPPPTTVTATFEAALSIPGELDDPKGRCFDQW